MYRRIQIGKNATDILALPCVVGCLKENSTNELYYLVDGPDSYCYAHARLGDWLCEDEQGRWHVIPYFGYINETERNEIIRRNTEERTGEAVADENCTPQ